MTAIGERRSEGRNLPPPSNDDGGSLAASSSIWDTTTTTTTGICFNSILHHCTSTDWCLLGLNIMSFSQPPH